jgi:hypothetical protein
LENETWNFRDFIVSKRANFALTAINEARIMRRRWFFL